MLNFLSSTAEAVWPYIRLWKDSSIEDSFSQNIAQDRASTEDMIASLQQRLANLQICEQEDINNLSEFCQEFIGGEEGGYEWGNIGFMLSLSVVGLVAAYYGYRHYSQSENVVINTSHAEHEGKKVALEPEYCKLTGKELGKNQAAPEFLSHFDKILSKYKGIEKELPETERQHLIDTLNALCTHYFWQKDTMPVYETDKQMRNGLYQKLALEFRAEKNGARTARFNELMGLSAQDDTMFTMIREIKVMDPREGNDFQKNRKFLKGMPNLSTALEEHAKRDIRMSHAKKV